MCSDGEYLKDLRQKQLPITSHYVNPAAGSGFLILALKLNS